MKWLKYSCTLFLTLGLIACGGDGVDYGDDDDDTGGGDTEPSVIVSLYDCSSAPSDRDRFDLSACEQTTSINNSQPGVIRVLAYEDEGVLATDELVTVISSVDLTTILGNGSSITNSDGIAIFDITADIDSSGAGAITATTPDASGSTNFSVGATNLSIAIATSLDDGTTELANGSSMVVSVTVTTDDGSLYTGSYETTFASGCVDQDAASIDAKVITSSGIARSTYSPTSCSGTDTITATTNISNLAASVAVDIALAKANSIEFISAEPSLISLKGSGGQESSILEFKVVDSQNLGITQQTVSFELSTALPGVTLNQTESVTGADGSVTVTVNSGTVHGSVAVIASFPDPDDATQTISTISSNLLISTGLPANQSLSMALSTFNPEAWTHDGELVDITVRAADHFKHPVPNGTEIAIRATAGAMVNGSCSTVDGQCTVKWRSQGARPSDGQLQATAFVVGEESFTDLNGNGVFDASDNYSFTLDNGTGSVNNNLPEVYIDTNNSGAYEVDEDEFIDYNFNGVRDAANGIYNGSLCSDTAEAASQCSKELLYISRTARFVMSGSNAVIKVYDAIGNEIAEGSVIDLTGGPVNLRVVVADENNNSMPGGTSITAEAANGEITQGASQTLLSTTSPHAYTLGLKADDTAGESDLLQIKVVTPKGIETPPFTLTLVD